MDDIPDFRSDEEKPFDIEKYVTEIRNSYINHYNKFIGDFREILSNQSNDVATILVHREIGNDKTMDIPYLKDMAAKNFVWELQCKKYPCNYITNSKILDNGQCENWAQINIALK
jgi:hypothetical protein